MFIVGRSIVRNGALHQYIPLFTIPLTGNGSLGLCPCPIVPSRVPLRPEDILPGQIRHKTQACNETIEEAGYKVKVWRTGGLIWLVHVD